MAINSVGFTSVNAQAMNNAKRAKKSSAVTAGALMTAVAIGGAYLLGKKAPNATDATGIKKVAQTVLAGFKSMPKLAKNIVNVVKEKSTEDGTSKFSKIKTILKEAFGKKAEVATTLPAVV